MHKQPLIAEAYERANAILHNCVTPHGFRASGLVAGYPQVWARDNGVIFLGAVATGDATLIATCRAAPSICCRSRPWWARSSVSARCPPRPSWWRC